MCAVACVCFSRGHSVRRIDDILANAMYRTYLYIHTKFVYEMNNIDVHRWLFVVTIMAAPFLPHSVTDSDIIQPRKNNTFIRKIKHLRTSNETTVERIRIFGERRKFK